jgi:hypothetical protein
MKQRFLNWICFRWPFYWIPRLRLRRDTITRFIQGQFVKTVYADAGPPYDTVTYPGRHDSGEFFKALR